MKLKLIPEEKEYKIFEDFLSMINYVCFTFNVKCKDDCPVHNLCTATCNAHEKLDEIIDKMSENAEC